MNFFSKIAAWWRSIFRKRRFSMLNATDNHEEWYIHISPASIFSALVAFLLMMFILILSLVAYSPVLEFLPGYRTEADRSRASLMQNIIRLDSMERIMNDMMTYNENIAMVLEGKTPVARTIHNSDSTRTSRVLVMPSHEDSLLRAQMEGSGQYALSSIEGSSRRQVREAIELLKPVEGIITHRFDIGEGRFGVTIAAPASERVTAIEGGTVVMSSWSPETGSAITLQHGDNMISIYKHLSQSLVITGQTVRAGELIGYSTDSEEESAPQFVFELWSNGKPVDPEGYILF